MAELLHRQSLLSSDSRIQVPWVKVQIGDYFFGVFDRQTKKQSSESGWFTQHKLVYPNYVKSLSVIKINGQVNQYTLELVYAVTLQDDPNFIEKVLSSVSSSREIIFTYGDAAVPTYTYKDEKALITGVTQSFDLQSGTINYTIKAVSSAVVAQTGSFTFVNNTPKTPSEEIKKVFLNSEYGLQKIFTGMSVANLDKLIQGGDREVKLLTKTNISPIDYILYLVGCMVPASASDSGLSNDIYILTLHDDNTHDKFFKDDSHIGPYFKVTRTSTAIERADAYEVDIGYNTRTIVRSFVVDQQENFAMYYDYNTKLSTEEFARRLNNQGQWEDVYAPMYTSGNTNYVTRSEDTVWFTKMTKYPISATLQVQGLLRPATLMQYLRLNVIFPGGRKHVTSGLYIVTKQVDTLNESGYVTALSLTRVAN